LKFGTALSSRIGRETARFNIYVSHGSTARFLRGGQKYYTGFQDNSLLFPPVKELAKSVNI